MAMSTVLVSEKGLPVSWVSTLARSSLRARRRDTAFSRMRERTIGGVLDHEGNAAEAEEMAESMSAWEALWIEAMGAPVAGLIDSKVLSDVAG